MKHVFTQTAPQIVVPVTAPFRLNFSLTPPEGWRPTSGVATRLLHVRTKAGKPRDTEVFEIKASGHDAAVVERSGFGKNKPQYKEPLKLKRSGRFEVEYADGFVTVNGESGETHLRPGGGVPLELVFGFDRPTGVLVSPLGWTLETDVLPATPEQPQPPVTPPSPPSPPPPTPPAVPPPVPPAPSSSAREELVRDLTALAAKYAAAQGVDPLILLALQLLVSRAKG